MKVIAAFDPLTYGVDGLRDSLLGAGHSGIGLDFLTITGLTILLLAIGSYLFSKIEV